MILTMAKADPALAVARRVRDRAEHRRQDGDDDAGDGSGQAPGELAGHGIVRHAGGEIGAEDEGDDDGEEGLGGPVEHHPAEEPALGHAGLGLRIGFGHVRPPAPYCRRNVALWHDTFKTGD
jgi:hypothetical protein